MFKIFSASSRKAGDYWPQGFLLKKKKKDSEKKEEEKKPEEPKRGPWGGVIGEEKKDDKPKTTKPSDYNDTAKKYDKVIQDLIGKSDKRKSGGGFGGGSGGNLGDKFTNSPNKVAGLVALGVFALWLLTGFYKVNPDENAIVLYFGKFNKITTPGLNYRIPYPVGKVIKQSITTVNTEEFGFVSKYKSRYQKNNDVENLMLTGDENIVDIEFQVQWQISDIEQFTFNVSQPRLAIRKAAESAMREVIAKTPISEALSDGKSYIEQSVRELLQQTLDSYSAGVRVVLVQLRRVDPPAQVIDAFRDVQTAKADKEREINEAQAYANDIIPRARGKAAEMQEQALAYKNQVLADAQGEAKRFLSILYQYRKAKELTRKRIYLRTVGDIYGNVDKVIIDNNVAKSSVVPYFPLSDIKKK